MPRGVYIRTEEHKKKISEALTGRTFTEEHKRKLSEAHRNKTFTEETKRKMSEAILRRKERDGYINSPKTRKKISERMKGEKNPNYGKELSEETKKKMRETKRKQFSEKDENGKCINASCYGKASWNKGLTKETDERVRNYSGKNSPFWNPNRAEVYAPYGENFYDEELRHKKWKLQNGRDMLTGTILDPDKKPNYHHIDYDKSNDDPDNHCFLSINNHMRITGNLSNPIKSERYKRILQENTLALKNGQIPKYWSQINKELFRQEKLKQLDLSSYII